MSVEEPVAPPSTYAPPSGAGSKAPSPGPARAAIVRGIGAGYLSLERLHRWLLASTFVRHRYAAWLALAAGMVVFSVFLGGVWATRYWAFQTNAWDLGVYFQAMHTTLVNHLLFYYTNDLPAGTHGYLFSSHFSPFLFLLLPPFALVPTPSGLLVIQAVGLALGAVPVHYLTRFYLTSGTWAALFAGLYLLSPLAMGTGWYDFHPEAFLPVTALTAFYLYERRRFYPFVAAWLLTLSVIETMAPFLLLFAAVALVVALWERSRTPPDRFREELRFTVTALGLAVAWYALAAAVVLSLNTSGGTFGAAYGQSWSVLGASSILDVFPRAITDPGAAAAALMFGGVTKGFYVLVLFGSFVFLPFGGRWKYLLPALAWVGLAVLSNDYAYFVINDQYVAYTLPFLIPAGLTGLVRLRSANLKWPGFGRRLPTVGLCVVVSLVVISVASSPLQSNPAISFNAVPHGLPVVTPHDELLHQVMALIPAGAGVLTTSRLFPELANRPNAYVSPVSSLFLRGLTFDGVVASYVNRSDYVLVDFPVDFQGAVILLRSANLTGFGLEAAAQGAYLYARGWTGPPKIWVPYTFQVAGGDLTPDLAEVDTSVSTPLGPTLYHPPTSEPGPVWQGPYLDVLPPGTYAVTASVELTANSAGSAAAFAVLNATIGVDEQVTPVGSVGTSYSFHLAVLPGRPYVISNQTFDWNGSGSNSPFAVWSSTFTWPGPGFLETEGFALADGVGLRLYSVTVTQLSPTG